MKPYFERSGIQIYHGDCRDVLPMLEAGSVDLVLTDPPYQSLDLEVGTGTTTRLVRRDARVGARLASADGLAWFDTLTTEELAGIWDAVQRCLKASGALYIFSDVKSGLQMFPPLAPANVIVWDKGSVGMGFNWRRMHEWIAFCPNPGHKLRDNRLGDIIRAPYVQQKQHPTEKPVSVLSTIIRNSSDPGELILDPFMGSGTTLRAAMDLGRRAIGIELSEAYCEIAANRLQQAVLPLEVA